MLRKIVVGTSAAVVAVGLAAAPALATGPPGSPAPCSETARTEQCLTVASTVAGFSSARRNSSAPPPVGTPVPEEPSSPPPDVPSSPPPGDSGPGSPGPGDSGPPAPAPPIETAGPPAAPEFTPAAPLPVEPSPAPTRAPNESGKPSETVLPTTEPRLPKTAVDSRPLTVAGGGSLVAAGLAWIGGARRRWKRQARPLATD